MDKSTKPTVPYVTDYDKEMTPQLSYDQTIELIVKDLTDALGLLDDEPLRENILQIITMR